MEALFLRMLVTAIILSVPLFVLLVPAREWMVRRYAPQVRWCMWCGMALVLLLGVSLSGVAAMPDSSVKTETYSVNVFQWQVETGIPTSGQPSTEQTDWIQPQTPTEENTGSLQKFKAPSLLWLAAAIWQVGCVAVVTWTVMGGLRCRRWLRRRSSLTHKMDAQAQHMGVRVQFCIRPGVSSPMTWGILHPTVYLPAEDVEPMVIWHELTHVQRKDLVWKMVLRLACIVYWFHPLVWKMAQVAERDMEAACDAQVVQGMSVAQKRTYGELLLSTASKWGNSPYVSQFGDSKGNMKGRLGQLFQPGKKRWGLVGLVLVLSVVTTGTVAIRTGSAASEVIRETTTPETTLDVVTKQDPPVVSQEVMPEVSQAPSISPGQVSDDPQANLFNKMLNTMDFFNRVTLTMETSMLDPSVTTVEYDLDIDAGISYQAVRADGKLLEETHTQDDVQLSVNHQDRYYSIRRKGIYHREDTPYMPLEERLTYEEDGTPYYRYRRNVTNCPLAAYCLVPQEWTFSYLSDFSNWEITQQQVEMLGRSCTEIQGVPNAYMGEKHGIDGFTMLIDEETGGIMKFQGTRNGQLIHYMTVQECQFEGEGEIPSIDPESYSSYEERYG